MCETTCPPCPPTPNPGWKAILVTDDPKLGTQLSAARHGDIISGPLLEKFRLVWIPTAAVSSTAAVAHNIRQRRQALYMGRHELARRCRMSIGMLAFLEDVERDGRSLDIMYATIAAELTAAELAETQRTKAQDPMADKIAADMTAMGFTPQPKPPKTVTREYHSPIRKDGLVKRGDPIFECRLFPRKVCSPPSHCEHLIGHAARNHGPGETMIELIPLAAPVQPGSEAK